MSAEHEIEWVDAADPGPGGPILDLDRSLDGERVHDPQAEAEERRRTRAADRARALQAATQHLERWARRARRLTPRVSHPLLERDFASARFCVIDTETTGASCDAGDDLLEIGAVRVVGGELDLEFSSLVRPRAPITAGAQAVHGITAEQASTAPASCEILPYLIEMARDCVLVFHNAPFDLGFLQRALADAGRPALDAPVVDTVVFARRLLGGRCGLGALGARLALAGPHLHRALPDARLTARLLVQLLEFLRGAGAIQVGQIPGIALRPARQRRRHAARSGVLLRRLQDAASRGEVVFLACRVGRGLAPLELRVRFLHVAPDACVVFDVDRRVQEVLDPARIVALEALS